MEAVAPAPGVSGAHSLTGRAAIRERQLQEAS